MIKKISLETAEILASKFRAKIGVSQCEPIGLKSVLRKLNILTIYKPISEELYGLSLKSKSGNLFMLVNSNTTRGRQHYTVAHELYHLFYDENLQPNICREENNNSNVSEKNADIFASALLMPKSGLLNLISEKELKIKEIDISTILKIEQYFSVSRQSLLYRLKTLKFITDICFRKLCSIRVKLSAKQYGYDVSLYNIGNDNLVIGDFGEKARVLYEKNKISEGHYLELLNLIENEEN